MPCDQIVRMQVEWEARDPAMVEAAFRRAGLSAVQRAGSNVSGYFRGTVVRWNGSRVSVDQSATEVVDELKRAYSREALGKAAKRYGWNIEERGGKLALKRRG